jgi:hypothetical protein
VVRAALDLGVELRTGRSAGPARGLAGRFGVALLRARRVARLPVPPRRRALLVAAGVVPVAAYGALVARVTAADGRTGGGWIEWNQPPTGARLPS